ncbi:MAG: HNH endonuclease signature motif containing protein [Tepidiformaceae bacterium]
MPPNRAPRHRPPPRWPFVLLVGLIALTLLALVAVPYFALQYGGGADTTTYTPVGNERPPGLVMPNRAISPGLASDATTAEVCVSGYATKARDVSTSTKTRVYAEYGIKSHAPGEYEIDHIIALQLGGSNDIRNLWPQPAEPRPGFHEKDDLAVKLHELVCAGRVDLVTAQQAMAVDWYASYLKYVLNR